MAVSVPAISITIRPPFFLREVLMNALKVFLLCHAGKGTVGVVAACVFLAWPPALAWITAVYLLYWAIGHFHESFRSLDAEPQPPPVAVVLRAKATPDPSEVDLLDRATALDMAARDRLPAVIPTWEIVPASVPVADEAADRQRRSA
jgi:hypothetical protein